LLENSGELEAMQKRLASYCMEITQAASSRAPVHDRSKLDRLSRESANFDAVLGWALSTHQAPLGLSLIVKLRDFWWVRGACAHGYAWLCSFLDLVDADKVDLDDGLLADVYWAASGLSEGAGAIGRSREFAAKALPLMRAREDRKAVASLLSGSGVHASLQGDFAAARTFLEEGLSIRRDIGDRALIAQSLCDLGQSAADEGDYARAASSLEEAIGHFRAAGSDLGVSAVLAVMAVVATRSGMPARAETFAREGLRIAKEVGYADGICAAAIVLSQALLARGEDAAAESTLTEALRMQEPLHGLGQAADLLRLFARIRHLRGEPVAAARLVGAASSAPNDRIVPAEREEHDAFVAALTAELGPRFEAEFTVGRATGARNAIAALSSARIS
jgi:tetratricopeptide (TPR) repeat protein